jgi:hypothetical protein
MNNPQYTEEQAKLLYDVLVHHSAATLAPRFDSETAKELDAALATLRMELSLFIAEGYHGDREHSESYDDDQHSQEWLDNQ